VEMPVLEKTPPVRTETGIGTPTRSTDRTGGLYEGFLELPIPVVLLTLWLTGVALVGLCASTLYYLLGLLLIALAGL
jgi:hypothetical protein